MASVTMICHHNTASAAACHLVNCTALCYSASCYEINCAVLIGRIIATAVAAAAAAAAAPAAFVMHVYQAADGNVEPADCALSSSSVLSVPSAYRDVDSLHVQKRVLRLKELLVYASMLRHDNLNLNIESTAIEVSTRALRPIPSIIINTQLHKNTVYKTLPLHKTPFAKESSYEKIDCDSCKQLNA
eukprot:12244-Heterococcus_DN1.PRE.1